MHLSEICHSKKNDSRLSRTQVISRGIIKLSITPTAKRNSYRVAILVGQLPRVAGHARNPGLCNRNAVRVAKGAYKPT